MSARFIDKLLIKHFENATNDIAWPNCMSPIGNIRVVDWGKTTVKVVDDMTFSFKFDSNVPYNIQGYTFTPPSLYFPLDVMLLLPDCKKTYKAQLETHRREMIATVHSNPGFQSFLNTQIRELDV
jgi:hypothetical protein